MYRWLKTIAPVRIILILAVALLTLVGCAGAADEAYESSDMYSPAAGEQARAGDSAAAKGNEISYYEAGLQGEQATEPLIIYTGSIEMVVTDSETATAEIAALVNGMGGRVVSSNLRQYSEGSYAGNMTVRVPAERFAEAMNEIQALATDVRRASQSSEDVTEEYVDLQARLRNLEATAARVRNFLDEASDVEEALAVNAELSRLESEIEAYKGRIQYLETQARFSTIDISLTPDALARTIEIGGWRPRGVALNAVEALVGALQGIGSLLIWLAIFVLPLTLIILLPLYLLWRRLGRRIFRRAAG